MKKSFMDAIIGSSGRHSVLIVLFQLSGSKAGLFEGNLFWVGQYDTPATTFQVKNCWHYHIDADVISFFVASKGKKIKKIDKK